MVAAFLEGDERDSRDLGEVGRMGGSLEAYLPIWRIVESGIPLADVAENWSYDSIAAYNEYLSMRRDYKAAWAELNERRTRDKDVRRI